VLAVPSITVGTVTPAFAQSKPAQRVDLIQRGRGLFEDQQYEESIQTLSAALVRPNNTKEQRLEVYRLLALNYITLNRKEEAESAVRGLLAQNPSYALPSSESPRFRDFFATVKAKWEAEGRPGLVTDAAPPPASVDLAHVSPSQVERNTDVPLSVKLDDPQGRVYDVKLFYRTGSKGKFTDLVAVLGNGVAKASIPKDAVTPPIVEYYFQGFDKGGLPIVSRGDAEAPLRIPVPEPKRPWLLPVAIGGGALVAGGAVVGILAATGAFKSAASKSTVSVSVGE
jgi:hypothetical protein